MPKPISFKPVQRALGEVQFGLGELPGGFPLSFGVILTVMVASPDSLDYACLASGVRRSWQTVFKGDAEGAITDPRLGNSHTQKTGLSRAGTSQLDSGGCLGVRENWQQELPLVAGVRGPQFVAPPEQQDLGEGQCVGMRDGHQSGALAAH